MLFYLITPWQYLPRLGILFYRMPVAASARPSLGYQSTRPQRPGPSVSPRVTVPTGSQAFAGLDPASAARRLATNLEVI